MFRNPLADIDRVIIVWVVEAQRILTRPYRMRRNAVMTTNIENKMENETDTETTVSEPKGTGLNYDKLFGAAMFRSNGRADIQKLLDVARKEAEAWVSENELDPDVLQQAVDASYATLPASQNKSIDIDSLVHRAINNLTKIVQVPDGSESHFGKHLKNFLRSESDRFVKSNGAEGRYHIGKGRGLGGVNLATDAYRASWRARQAEKAAENNKAS
jgi:hypothetical protein